MTDIERWIETDAPDDIVESLRAARAESPRRAVVERCVALIGAVGTVGLSAQLASAASFGSGGKAASSLAILKWGLSGVAAGALFVSAVEVARRATAPEPMPSSRAVSVATPRASSEPRTVPSSAPVTVPAPPATSTPQPTSSPKPRSVVATDAHLAAELALLDRVRSAIDARDARRSGELLDDHYRRYGKDAPLAPEARYLRLEALEIAGRRAEARNVAREILAREPHGPHAARARDALEKE